MKNDISRQSYDPRKHFSRVLMQQGRVQLDADWNEQVSIFLHYLRTLATDLIGPHAGPAANCGFGIIDAERAVKDRASLPWKDVKEDEIKKAAAAAGFYVGPGRYYVDGLLCENDDFREYTSQGDAPLESTGKLAAGDYAAYLDVWERHVSGVEDEDIKEVALHGLDTATRAKVVWQVKLLKLDPAAAPAVAPAPGPAPAPAAHPTCDAGAAALAKSVVRDLPRLRARPAPGDISDDPCTLSPDSRYRGPENQLYRVEIHHGGDAKTATFKWSRENGSVIFPVLNVVFDERSAQTTVSLANFGPDASLGLREGDWVELVDDISTLQGRADPLLKVHAIQREDGLVIFTGKSALTFVKNKHALLRRWDQSERQAGATPLSEGTIPVTLAAVGGTGWLDLEYGLQVQFGLPPAGQFRTGDYWLIPTRVSDVGGEGLIQWPRDTAADGTTTPADRPPSGIAHHYAPLAVVSVDGDGKVNLVTDCRTQFSPLPGGPPATLFPDPGAVPVWSE